MFAAFALHVSHWCFEFAYFDLRVRTCWLLYSALNFKLPSLLFYPGLSRISSGEWSNWVYICCLDISIQYFWCTDFQIFSDYFFVVTSWFHLTHYHFTLAVGGCFKFSYFFVITTALRFLNFRMPIADSHFQLASICYYIEAPNFWNAHY